MSTSATPGPWQALLLEGPYKWPFRVIQILTQEDVAIMSTGSDVDRYEASANARLIAAAPCLLAACQRMLAMYDAALATGTGQMWKGADVDALRAAVAKATGGDV